MATGFTRCRAGGQLNDSGSHLLDVVLWMVDLAPARVSAFMDYLDTEVDINSALSIVFENGALANFSVVGTGPGPGMWEDITIWGTKGAIYSRNGRVTCKYGGNAPVEVDANSLPSRFASPDQNFVDAILGRDEIQVPPVCGFARDSVDRGRMGVGRKRWPPGAGEAGEKAVGDWGWTSSRQCRGRSPCRPVAIQEAVMHMWKLTTYFGVARRCCCRLLGAGHCGRVEVPRGTQGAI